MARSNLLKDTVSGKVDIENILLRLKIILSDLEDDNILGWIEGELRGYGEGDIVPEYRMIKGRAMGTYVINQRVQYKNALVPLNFTELNEKMIEQMLSMNVKDGISIIEKNLKSENRNKLGKPISTEICHSISSYQLQILNITVMYSANDFETILSKVKDKIVDIIMVLEKNFGADAIDEMDISKQVIEYPGKKQEAVMFINQVVYNDTPTTIDIGDKNKIKQSKIGEFLEKINENKNRK